MKIENFFPDAEQMIKFIQEEGFPNGGVTHNDYFFSGFMIPPDFIKEYVTDRLEKAYNRPIVNVTCTFRRGVESRILVHTDISMGTHTAVVYLTDNIGTAFWKDLKTGEDGVSTPKQDAQNAIDNIGNDPARWELTKVSEGDMNTCMVYDSTKYHSIYPYKDLDNRLVCVTFFTLG